MITKFNRPSNGYIADASLPNTTLFQAAQTNKQAINAKLMDDQINFLVDACNTLNESIQTAVISGISGAKDSTNANKFLFTDGTNIGFKFVETVNIAPNAIALSTLQTGNTGELISWDSNRFPVAVGKGTENYVLTAKAPGVPPIFEDPSQNDLIKALLKILVPPGSIFHWGGSAAPVGYILADGSSVSRTTYRDLFGVFGTTYGEGDGSSTFGIPDLKGRVIVAPDVGANRVIHDNALGDSGGEEKHQLTIGELPSHNFQMQFPNYNTAQNSGSVNNLYTGNPSQQPVVTINTNTIGSNQPHNNMQPYIVLNAIIKT